MGSDLLNSLLVDGAFIIDNSSFEYITTCPRSAFYHIVRKRKSAEEKAALNFGGAVHAALEVRYKKHDGHSPISDELYQEMVGAAMAYMYVHPVESSDFRNPSRLAGILAAYNKQYPNEPFQVYNRPQPAGIEGAALAVDSSAVCSSNDSTSDTACGTGAEGQQAALVVDPPPLPLPGSRPGGRCVELPFAVPLGEIKVGDKVIPIIWIGKIDAVLFWEDRFWILDHKTTSILGATYFEQFYLSSQMRGYCWAAEKMVDQPISGAIINVLGIRKETKTGKSQEFIRQRFMYTREQLDEWQQNTMYTINAFFQNAVNEYFPQYNAWCVGKFGKCQYFDICTLPSHQRETMLKSGNYGDVTWSPLNND